MKSTKQRKVEIKKKRRLRQEARAAWNPAGENKDRAPLGTAPVDVNALAPNNSYGVPKFVERGYYQDISFCCQECGKDEVWTASQQKWWYEIAKGYVYSGAKLCRLCRRRKREQSAESRRVHLEGLARKALKKE